jgi:hypothetical protein
MPRIIQNALVQGARLAMNGLSGALAKQEAARWAALAGVHVNRVYEWTKDVRPSRKTRVDKGKRTADINHPMVKFAMECVLIRGRLDPDLAIETAEENFPEEQFPISLGTFRRYLREYGVDRKQRRSSRAIKLYRPFEARNPMDIYQFDITGLKERWWSDVTTRRILKTSELEVSKNHPNENPNRVPLWAFQLVDDCSRFRYVRFFACLKPNTCHVIDFLWSCFRELGIPLVLYTDNDPIIISRKMRDAAAVLDRVFASSGGFKLEQHVAGNPNATGKVEAAHRIVAKFWNLIGVKYETPGLVELNEFAARVDVRLNSRVHSATHAIPLVRFRAGFQAMRLPPPAVLDSAFKADKLRLSITARVTISVSSVEYQLPRSEMVFGPGAQRLPNPFLNRAGKKGDAFKIDVVWPPDQDYFLAIVDGTHFEIERRLAVADTAGQYKVTAETIGQQTWKALEASAKERKRAFRTAKRDLDRDLREGLIGVDDHRRMVAEIDLKVPLIDVPPAIAAVSSLKSQVSSLNAYSENLRPETLRPGTVAVLPRQRLETDPSLLAAVSSGIVPPSLVSGRLIDYWSALSLLIEEGLLSSSEFDKAWLLSQFNGDEDSQANDTELREALARRVSSPSVREGAA